MHGHLDFGFKVSVSKLNQCGIAAKMPKTSIPITENTYFSFSC